MKVKKINLMLLLLSALVLSGCGGDTSSSSVDDTSSGTVVETDIDEISSIRGLAVGTEVKVRGVVANMNYTGQGVPYLAGFWLADNSGSIYVYSELVALDVAKGSTVTMFGTKAYYIPETDSGSAPAVGYVGMLQLINPEIVSINLSVNQIPASAIAETTIAEINQIPLTTDITGNIYRVKGHWHRYDSGSYVNYGVEDLNRFDSLLAYTQSNGKDFYWTDSYDAKTVEMIIIISLGKPSVGMWRICPVSFIGEITLTPLQEAEYAAERALNQIANTYDVQTTVNVSINDEVLDGVTRSYSSASDKVVISQTGGDNVLLFKVSEVGSFTLTAIATYQSQSSSKTKTITIQAPETFGAVTLAEAKLVADGEEVTVLGIVAKISYKGSMTKQGLFLVDVTGSLFVYNDAASQGNLADIKDGNKVIVTGKMTHYIKNADNATAENYSGDQQLGNVTVRNIDANVYELPVTAFVESTIEDIVATLPAVNISGVGFKVSAKVVKNPGSYPSYDLFGLVDQTKKLPLYSQNSGADFVWLNEYDGLEVEIYVGVQNLNLRAADSNWRGLPLQVIRVLPL